MHPALQIHELLYLVFRNLLVDWYDCRLDLLSCCFTCKAFREAALDIIWEDLPSVTIMPFVSPLEYMTALNPRHHDYNASAYQQHLERLKFYGRRVRVLRVHSKLTPKLLMCISRLAADPSSTPSLSASMHTIFPGLTTLSLVLSGSPLYEENSELRIQTFLLPTVRDLSLRFAAGAHYGHLTEALRLINTSCPSLTSLLLDAEISGPQAPPAELDSELATLIDSLPQLETLRLPLHLLTLSVLTAIAGLPALEHLNLSHPTDVQWRRSVPSGSAVPTLQEHPQAEYFSALRSLVVDSIFDFIPRILYMHPSLTSHISQLSLSSLPPPPRMTLKTIFLPTLSSPALHGLRHLSLNFTVPIYMPQRDGLGADFFATLFAAPFISRLVSFSVQHRMPLDLNDKELDDMAGLMPSLESLHLTVVPFDPPRGVPRPGPPRVRASLGALVSFAKHCPKLREITLPVDAETLPIPANVPLVTFARPVAVNLSVSPIEFSGAPEGLRAISTAKFLAALFPQRSKLTSQWADHAEASVKKIGNGGGEIVEGDDYRARYARNWKIIGELAQQERQIQCN